MNMSFRNRLRKEVAFTACLGLGGMLGFMPTQVFAQVGQDVAASSEMVRAKNVQQSAISQSVSVTPDGQLVGQVQVLGAASTRPAGGMNLSLLGMDGRSVETLVDDRGGFAFRKVSPGVYALFGRSGNMIVCQSIRVFDNESQVDSALQLFAVSPTSPEIEKVIFSGYSASTMNADTTMLPVAPSNYSYTNGLVALSNDGVMQGRLWSVRGDVSGTSVYIYQNGVSVARATADSAGKFSVKLAPGTYSLLASGTGGVAAVGFKAEGSNASFSKTKVPKNVKLVALEMAVAAPVLVVGLAPPPPASEQQQSTTLAQGGVVKDGGVVPTTAAPLAGGGYGGGFGGGGGGFGGGFGGGGSGAGGGLGGLGGLAAIGAIAAVGIAAADKNKNAPTTVVSPSGQ